MKVYNLTSPRTGNAVANQFMLEAPTGKYFQSYESVIASLSLTVATVYN